MLVLMLTRNLSIDATSSAILFFLAAAVPQKRCSFIKTTEQGMQCVLHKHGITCFICFISKFLIKASGFFKATYKLPIETIL